MISWPRLADEHRALAALAAALLFFVPLFLLAPADDWRVVALAALAGGLTAVVCWQHFPGWDLFVAGCALSVAGAFHAAPPDEWTAQAILLLPAAASWYAGARLGESWVVFPLGHEERTALGGMARLLRELGRGCLVTASVGGVSWVTWSLFLEAAAPLAFPLALILTMLADGRWPVRRPLWAALGLLMALPAAGGVAGALARALSLPLPAAADPWLVGGLSILGSIWGLWLSRWRRGETHPDFCGAPLRESSH
jgi:hypothetical protein